MYIESLESFIQQAEELYNASPLKTRYVVKYRHCDGKLVLKVTDDVTVRRSTVAPPHVVTVSPVCFGLQRLKPSSISLSCFLAVPPIQDKPAIRP
jgi:hypothetical protein